MNIMEFVAGKGVWEYKQIDTEQIPLSEEVVDACKANRCGQYGTCWTCPPGVGTLAEIRERIAKYSKAVVFSCKYDLEDSFDLEGMQEAGKNTREMLAGMVSELRESGVDFMALGCGSCDICEKCTYPDAPCRFPDKAIVSVEACGINVVTLPRSIGIRYNNGPDTVTYFCMILYTE